MNNKIVPINLNLPNIVKPINIQKLYEIMKHVSQPMDLEPLTPLTPFIQVILVMLFQIIKK